MPSRRKSRFDKLFYTDVKRFVEDAMRLRETILSAQLHLTSCDQSKALSRVHDALLEALPVVLGRPIDIHRGDLGVVPFEGIPPLNR